MNGKKKRLSENKEKFLTAYRECEGVITEAMKHVGLDRTNYNYWMKSDPDFKEAIMDIDRDFLIDIHRSLIKEAKEGKITFWQKLALMDRLGKNLGYTQKIETETTKNIDIKISLPKELQNLLPNNQNIISIDPKPLGLE